MRADYEKYITDGKCILPDDVTIIPDWEFFGCEELKYIEIPDSVVEIGASAFCCCINLKSCILIINTKEPSESVSFINRVLESFDSYIKLTVHVPIGSGYAFRHYPEFVQKRLDFVPCNLSV